MSTQEIESLKRHFTQEIAKMERIHKQAISEVEKQRSEDMAKIMAVLQPMADTYNTANTAARWIKKIVVFGGALVGLIIGVKKLTDIP